MLTLTISLLSRDRNHQVELILFSLHDFANGFPHLLHQVNVELRVELVTRVLFETLQGTSHLEVFSDDADDSLLHLLFKDVVLAASVDFVKEFLLALIVSLISFFLRHWDLSLSLQVLLEHLVVFSCQGFNGNRYLLSEVIIARFGERPHDQLLQGQDVAGLGFGLG